MIAPRLAAVGDAALRVEFENRVDAAVNARAVALAQVVEAARVAGVHDVVPAYRSVTVYFDPLRTDYQAIYHLLDRESATDRGGALEASATLSIPAKYGGDEGPDLAEVAFAEVKAGGMEDTIEIRWGNALDVDMSEATVVFLFMGEAFNLVMRPLLWKQLRVGARVVSKASMRSIARRTAFALAPCVITTTATGTANSSSTTTPTAMP